MYAKSNFWEDPLVTTGKCTHYATYSNDAKKVQVCKDQDADEATCLSEGNFYTLSADINRCGGTAYRVHSIPSLTTVTSAADGQTKCQAACNTAGVECDVFGFVADATIASSVCTLYHGACTAESGGAATGDIIGTKTRHCYFTTKPAAATYTDCACKVSGDVTVSSDVDYSTAADSWFSCH
jgi:hypothetical protein